MEAVVTDSWFGCITYKFIPGMEYVGSLPSYPTRFCFSILKVLILLICSFISSVINSEGIFVMYKPLKESSKVSYFSSKEGVFKILFAIASITCCWFFIR